MVEAIFQRGDDNPLNQEDAIFLLRLVTCKSLGWDFLEDDPMVQIIQRRIEVCKLPISIDSKAMAYILVLADGVPGKAIVILIDLLDMMDHRHEQEENPLPLEQRKDEIKIEDVVSLYPMGFYNEKHLEKVISRHKNKKHTWSWIY